MLASYARWYTFLPPQWPTIPPPLTVITSNRAVEEWLSLFDDPILGNSALDRMANASFQIVIEGSSYREKLFAAPETAGRQGRRLTPRRKPDKSLNHGPQRVGQ